jgi:hypothetical protein
MTTAQAATIVRAVIRWTNTLTWSTAFAFGAMAWPTLTAWADTLDRS